MPSASGVTDDEIRVRFHSCVYFTVHLFHYGFAHIHLLSRVRVVSLSNMNTGNFIICMEAKRCILSGVGIDGWYYYLEFI